jgi:hypothetical protein
VTLKSLLTRLARVKQTLTAHRSSGGGDGPPLRVDDLGLPFAVRERVLTAMECLPLGADEEPVFTLDELDLPVDIREAIEAALTQAAERGDALPAAPVPPPVGPVPKKRGKKRKK